jgi:hypothetical protein
MENLFPFSLKGKSLEWKAGITNLEKAQAFRSYFYLFIP